MNPADQRSKVYYCEKCNKTMKSDNFYSSNNLEKYPNDGKFPFCRVCMTMHVDNFDPSTYLWILQEADVPYIPDEWNKLLAKYGQDRASLKGTSIVGRYLSKMKLKQWKNYRWKDNEFLQELNNSKIRTTMEQSGYDEQHIVEAITRSTFTLPEDTSIPDSVYEPLQSPYGNSSPGLTLPGDEQEDYFSSHALAPEPEMDLTEEDIRMLSLKWGKTYRPNEWVQLEQLYQDMLNSYDIQAAGDINTLKLACKASLKANQLMDMGDIEGAQKMSKVYNEYMKSGKWTAQQNKTQESEQFDSVGQLVAECERHGFIARYHIDEPKDKADRVIADMQYYTHDLVTNELNLGLLIENSIRLITDEKERIQEAQEKGEENEEDELFNYERNIVLEDADFEALRNLEAEMYEDDEDEYERQGGN